jgi:predicted type IV restriction endonuclease
MPCLIVETSLMGEPAPNAHSWTAGSFGLRPGGHPLILGHRSRYGPARMANYILNFTRRGTKDKKAMPAQARLLLEVGLWGVPPTAQLREKLVAGDRVLIFVGAPDRVFLGDAIVAVGYHGWTKEETVLYPMTSTFDHGIRLAEARVWHKPLPIGSVWSETQGAKSNPKALWYGAITSLSAADADLILSIGRNGAAPVTHEHPSSSAQGGAPSPSPTPSAPKQILPSQASGNSDSSALFSVGEKLKRFLAHPKPINEDGTRAFFIDKMLDALGYSDFDDLEHGSSQASGTFPDYILRANGKRAMAVEAKRLGAALAEKEAAQLVSYCSVVGVRWGALTDGRQVLIYDAPVVGIPPEERLVLQIDLADYADRDDFDARLWPAAVMLTKSAMATGELLERHAARELVRTILADAKSATVKALQKELQARKVIVSTSETAAILAELIG